MILYLSKISSIPFFCHKHAGLPEPGLISRYTVCGTQYFSLLATVKWTDSLTLLHLPIVSITHSRLCQVQTPKKRVVRTNKYSDTIHKFFVGTSLLHLSPDASTYAGLILRTHIEDYNLVQTNSVSSTPVLHRETSRSQRRDLLVTSQCITTTCSTVRCPQGMILFGMQTVTERFNSKAKLSILWHSSRLSSFQKHCFPVSP